jgi:hypothetical protein
MLFVGIDVRLETTNWLAVSANGMNRAVGWIVEQISDYNGVGRVWQ